METALEELGTLFRSGEGDEQVRTEAIAGCVPLLHVPTCRGGGGGGGGGAVHPLCYYLQYGKNTFGNFTKYLIKSNKISYSYTAVLN